MHIKPNSTTHFLDLKVFWKSFRHCWQWWIIKCSFFEVFLYQNWQCLTNFRYFADLYIDLITKVDAVIVFFFFINLLISTQVSQMSYHMWVDTKSFSNDKIMPFQPMSLFFFHTYTFILIFCPLWAYLSYLAIN